MTNIIGGLLIVAAGAYTGIAGSDSLKQRMRALDKLCDLTRELELTLSACAPPAPELFGRLSKDPRFSDMDIWDIRGDSISLSLAENIRRSRLPIDSEARELMYGYLSGFGRNPIEGEVGRIQLLRSRLAPLRDRAEQEWRTSGRVRRMLGVSTGMMLALIVI